MKILFLDDDAERQKTFRRRSVGHNVEAVWNADDAILALQSVAPYDVAFLDHDLGGLQMAASDEHSGYRVAQHIATMPEAERPRLVIIHSFNEEGAQNMLAELQRVRYRRAMCAMFGTAAFWSALEANP